MPEAIATTTLRQRPTALKSSKAKEVTVEEVEADNDSNNQKDDVKSKLSTNNAVDLKEKSVWTPLASKLFTAITILTVLTRLYKINEPSEVVFDEVHFGGFASLYLRREYFFDVHPPLGKLLIAALGYFCGYEGNFTFASIGLSYAGSTAPYVALRTMMAFFGWTSIAFAFMSLLELGFSEIAAGFTASLLVFDMAHCVQTRFILLDSPLMSFILASLYSWIRFRKLRYQAFSKDWWLWLAATGASIGAATSVKMVGILTVITVGIATVLDLWELADKERKMPDRLLAKHFFARALCLIALPFTIYCGCFYAHFAILNRTGPGDGLMSPAFQATLIGNQMHQESRVVKFGHTIRIKSRLENIFLHSHAHNYPQIHEDKKVSSAGQQVTGYPTEDSNNLWKILPVDLSASNNNEIRNGDKVRLLHVKTGKYLQTHDVASPLTRTNMEMTVCDGSNEELMTSAIWIIDIKSGGDILKTKSCHLRIMNSVHNVALTNWQQPLPAWGFGHREINGDKRGVDENCVWSIWDVVEAMDEKEANAKKDSKLPTMNLLQKYWELQKASIRINAKLIDNHPFKSDPVSWPFVLRGVSFWDKGKDSRIYLLGNIFAWYTALFGICVAASLLVKELYKERRGIYDRTKDRFNQRFGYRAGFILLAWAVHYFPFFTMSRTLYLHHYLPAYIMSAMVAGCVLDYYLRRLKTKGQRLIAYVLLAGFTVLLGWTFVYFSPIVYGSFFKSEAIKQRKWISTWDWTA